MTGLQKSETSGFLTPCVFSSHVSVLNICLWTRSPTHTHTKITPSAKLRQVFITQAYLYQHSCPVFLLIYDLPDLFSRL